MRTCDYCGSLIDPLAWCPECRRSHECLLHGKKKRLRKNARFCGKRCRQAWWREARRQKPSKRHGRCPRTKGLPLGRVR